MTGALARIAGLAVGLLYLAACSTATSPMLEGSGNLKQKGRAVFYAGTVFGQCVSVTATFARRKPDGTYEAAGTSFINYDFLWATKLGGIDLEPGDYVVSSLICPRRDYSILTYSGPLGSFTIHAGEIVDLGSITAVSIPKRGDQDSVGLVEPNPEKRLSTLMSDPDLARRYVSRPLATTATLQDLNSIEDNIVSAPETYDKYIMFGRLETLRLVRSARSSLSKGAS